MSVWPVFPLGDVLSADRDVVYVEPTGTYRTAGIYSHGRGMFWRPEVTGAEVSYTSYVRLKSGHFVFSKLFAWEGALAVVPPEFDGALVSSEFPSYSIDTTRIDPSFLAFYVRRKEFYLSLVASGVGNRRQRVSPSSMLSAEITLPSVAEQHRIVEELKRVEEAVDTYEDLATRQDLAVAAWRNRILRRLSDSKEHARLGDFLKERVDPEDVNVMNEYRSAGVLSHAKGLFWRPAVDGATTSYRTLSRLRTGDLVMSKLFAWEGAMSVVPPEFDGAYVSAEFPSFSISHDVDPGYIKFVVSWPEFYARLRTSGLGNRRQRVNPSVLMATEIPVPSIQIQREIGRAAGIIGECRALRLRSETRVKALSPAALNQVFGSPN